MDMLKNKSSEDVMKIYVTLSVLNKMLEKEEVDRKEFENKEFNNIEKTLDDYNLELIFI